MSGKPGIRIDLKGQRFGRLVVIGKTSHDMKTSQTKWSCHCDCGNNIEVRGGNLRNGHSQSCGCLRRDNASKTFKAHGKSHTRLFNIWCSMRQRCRDKNCANYPSYGGRGITVCESWEKDFTVFEAWALNNGYADNLSIDRINVNGIYEPSNCRWADIFTQQNNTRNNSYITIDGETHTYAEWERIKGLKINTIHNRIRKGWKPEEAVIGKRRKR
jgi:hypothetical protein